MFNITVVLINLVTIAIVLVVGFPHAERDNWDPFVPNGVGGVFKASSVVFFSYIGFDTLATTAEEVGLLPRCTFAFVLHRHFFCWWMNATF